MSYHNNQKDRERRSRKLVEGTCCCCEEEAMIPWKGNGYCYNCWNYLWACIRGEDGKKKEKEKSQQ